MDHKLHRRTLGWLAVGCATFAVYGSLLPFQFQDRTWVAAIADVSRTSLWSSRVGSVGDFGSNVLLFIPIGFCFLGLLRYERSRTSGWTPAIVVGASVLLSGALEIAQAFIPGRWASLADVEAETLGTLIGIGLWYWRGPAWTLRLSGQVVTALKEPRVIRQLTTYAAAYVLSLLLPLDLTIRPGDIIEKYHHGRLVHAVLGAGEWEALDLLRLALATLLATPLGVLAVLGWTRGPAPRLLPTAITLGVVGILCIAVAQVFVFSRATDLTAVLTGAGGVVVGATAAAMTAHSWGR